MKKILVIAAIAALGACSKPAEEAPAPAETTAAMPEAPATMTAADAAGTYDVKAADGTMTTVVINADGSYTDTAADGKVEKGMWSWKDGKSCFNPEGDAPEMCWTDGTPDANGVFTATAPDGTVVTVTPQAKPAAAATTDAMATPAPAAT